MNTDPSFDFDKGYRDMTDRGREWRELCARVKSRNVVDLTAGLPIRKVLEVGCGNGALLAALSKRGFGAEYWGIDVTPVGVEAMLRRDDIPPMKEGKVFDGRDIPYPAATFDLAVFSTVLEHVPDAAHMLAEACRVARYVFVEIPLDVNLYSWFREHVMRRPYLAQIGRRHAFSWASLRRFIEECPGGRLVAMRMAPLSDEIHKFSAGTRLPIKRRASLAVRHALRAMAPSLYRRLLPDHCVFLLESRA